MKTITLATLDVGTSYVKGALWTTKGNCIQYTRKRLKPLLISSEKVEQDLCDIEECIVEVLRELSIDQRCRALAITSQRDTFLLQKNHQPITRLISWMDARGVKLSQNRYDWYAHYDQEVFQQADSLRSLMSWLYEELTGYPYDSLHTAPRELRLPSCVTIHDIEAPLLVAPTQFQPYRSQRKIFENLLPPELPIIIAGGDKNCELIGSGYLKHNAAILSTGTALSLGTLTTRSPSDTRKIYVTHSLIDQHVQIEVGLPRYGLFVDWLQKQVPGVWDFHLSLPETDDPVIFLPSFSSHLDYSFSNEKFFMQKEYSKNKLLALGVESVILSLMQGQKYLSVQNFPVKKIILSGVAMHPQFNFWLADALQCEVAQLKNPIAGLAGAAMIAEKVLFPQRDWLDIVENYLLPISEWIAPSKHDKHWKNRFSQRITHAIPR